MSLQLVRVLCNTLWMNSYLQMFTDKAECESQLITYTLLHAYPFANCCSKINEPHGCRGGLKQDAYRKVFFRINLESTRRHIRIPGPSLPLPPSLTIGIHGLLLCVHSDPYWMIFI